VVKYVLACVIIIYLFTAVGLVPGGSGYFTCKQNMKSVTTRFKSEGLHEKHVVATWNLGNHLSISTHLRGSVAVPTVIRVLYKNIDKI